MLNAKKLIQEYEYGLGYKKGDVLVPRTGCSPHTFDVQDDEVVVIEQNCLIKHEYLVIGKKKDPKNPSDTFVKFSVNGYEWEKAN